MKIVLLLFVIATFALQAESDIFESLASDLPKKYCPMRNWSGQLFCPESNDRINGKILLDTHSDIKLFGNASKSKVETPVFGVKSNDRIFGGFGYDRTKRNIKFPVLTSTQPVPIWNVEHSAKKFTTINEFLSHVFVPQTTFENGLYTREDQFMGDFVMQFGEYTVNIGISQAYYATHTTNIASNTPIPEFQDVIEKLPPWDPNNQATRNYYNMIIHFWGTDVATQTTHGGVIYQQTAIKACYGGSVTEDMIKDIDAAIKKIPPGNLAYLRYRRLGVFEARGGNPEYGMDRTAERIASFATCPAPIRFNVIPLWQVVADPTKREWLKQAIQKYFEEFMPTINLVLAKVQEERSRKFKGVQPVHFQKFNVEQEGRFTARWKDCPIVHLKDNKAYVPHCTLLRPFYNLAASQKALVYEVRNEEEYLVYLERDTTTGFTRLISYADGVVHKVSNWAQQGCANIVGPSGVCYFSFCMDCLPTIEQQPAKYNEKHTYLKCLCPAF